mmetsp:Transcript_23870/g.73486  ORF Transcript_23870/g.73486 Transcript_23870/m.73486 type:complete len:265 (-) Transcript_23870:437-1231(-)
MTVVVVIEVHDLEVVVVVVVVVVVLHEVVPVLVEGAMARGHDGGRRGRRHQQVVIRVVVVVVEVVVVGIVGGGHPEVGAGAEEAAARTQVEAAVVVEQGVLQNGARVLGHGAAGAGGGHQNGRVSLLAGTAAQPSRRVPRAVARRVQVQLAQHELEGRPLPHRGVLFGVASSRGSRKSSRKSSREGQLMRRRREGQLHDLQVAVHLNGGLCERGGLEMLEEQLLLLERGREAAGGETVGGADDDGRAFRQEAEAADGVGVRELA